MDENGGKVIEICIENRMSLGDMSLRSRIYINLPKVRVVDCSRSQLDFVFVQEEEHVV